MSLTATRQGKATNKRRESAVRKMLKRPIAFHAELARIGGGALPGLMLSQAIYWTEVKEATHNDEHPFSGWFWKTREEWERETAMRRGEQDRAAASLLEHGLIEIEKRGLPCRRFFRVNMDAVIRALEETEAPSLEDVCKLPCNTSANLSAGGMQTLYTESTPETTPERQNGPGKGNGKRQNRTTGGTAGSTSHPESGNKTTGAAHYKHSDAGHDRIPPKMKQRRLYAIGEGDIDAAFAELLAD